MLLFSFLTATIYQIIVDKSIGLHKLKKPVKKELTTIDLLNEEPIISVIGGIICLIIFRYYLSKSISLSSNPTFPRVIFNSQYILTLILSLFIIKNSEITNNNILAAILMIIGVLRMSF